MRGGLIVWDSYSFKICNAYLSALINGDYSGIDDGPELAAWVSGLELPADGHWSYSDESDDWGPCAVTGLFADRANVSFHFKAENHV